MDHLRFIERYSTEVDYLVINPKGQYREKAMLFYSSKAGHRLELGEERVLLYKKEGITVQDLKNNKSYELKSDYDEFYRWAFIREFITLIYTNEEVKIYSQEKEGKNYLFIELYIPGGNKHIHKGILQVNKETKAPELLTIYDSDGELRAEITYLNFKFEKELDEKLFNY